MIFENSKKKNINLAVLLSYNTKNKKKSLILVNKFIVKFVNRKSISIKYNMLIKNYIRKYLLLSIVVII